MAEARVMKAPERHEFFRRMREINPHPKSDLEYRSAFELLVAVILSAQATDKSVNTATKKLYAVANTPDAILALGRLHDARFRHHRTPLFSGTSSSASRSLAARARLRSCSSRAKRIW